MLPRVTSSSINILKLWSDVHPLDMPYLQPLQHIKALDLKKSMIDKPSSSLFSNSLDLGPGHKNCRLLSCVD